MQPPLRGAGPASPRSRALAGSWKLPTGPAPTSSREDWLKSLGHAEHMEAATGALLKPVHDPGTVRRSGHAFESAEGGSPTAEPLSGPNKIDGSHQLERASIANDHQGSSRRTGPGGAPLDPAHRGWQKNRHPPHGFTAIRAGWRPRAGGRVELGQ